MSTEPEPETSLTDPPQPQTPEPPVEEPPAPTLPPPPPAPTLPDPPLVFEPFTYYSIDNVCLTVDVGDGTPCPHLNLVYTEPQVYSNMGTPVICCWPCEKNRVFLAATKLDPQPEVV